MIATKKRLLIFASGTANGGGSGFRKLAEAARDGTVSFEIAGAVSNHENGGVRKIAKEFGIQFHYFEKPFNSGKYRYFFDMAKADFAALSGWTIKVLGLPEDKTFNIHPAPVFVDYSSGELVLKFGGRGWFGHSVHERVLEAFRRGEITHSAVVMHFVTGDIDGGPVFFRIDVPISPDDDADKLGKRVNQNEHYFQAAITDLVVSGKIRLEKGKVIVPEWYPFLPQCR